MKISNIVKLSGSLVILGFLIAQTVAYQKFQEPSDAKNRNVSMMKMLDLYLFS